MTRPKRFVYILKNAAHPPRYCTGITADAASRLWAHNDGHCRHTATGRPWHLDVVIEFADERRNLTDADIVDLVAYLSSREP